jgi:tartrate-resistant acid phosphatase type 5
VDAETPVPALFSKLARKLGAGCYGRGADLVMQSTVLSVRVCVFRTFTWGGLALVLACSRRPPEPTASREASPLVPTASANPAAATSPNLLEPAPRASAGASGVPPVSSAPAGNAWPEGFRFAAVGDFGAAGPAERQVADLVKAFHPEVVITLGDNNYPTGGADTIDPNIGQFYGEYIGHYAGKFGKGASDNRFFPALGNHDWYTEGAKPYLDYFTLPGNERYYAFSRGPVDFFALDSDPHEPDGTAPESKQAAWLKAETQKAHGAWQIVYMHHPPYSSGPHGSTHETEWPYREWGIDLVLAGHDHTYERFVVGGLTFLVNGLGGAPEYEFKQTAPASLFRYRAKHGAQLAVATKDELRITFVNVDGVRIDEVVLRHDH